MKVLHINCNDIGGGAAIAAYRHHVAMRRAGIDSKMLVINKCSSDENVIRHKSNGLISFARRVANRLFITLSHYYASWSCNLVGCDLSREWAVSDADVIYIHWINFFSLSINSLERILKTGKPVYWFMHDMWPITGGCHYALGCDRFMSHCQQCPMGNNRRGSTRRLDLSYLQFEVKLKHLSQYKNLHFITPSQWLGDMVKKSALFKDHDVQIHHNVLDTDVFVQRDKIEARKRLNLPINKKLILFGAENIGSPYKGWTYLRDALREPLDGVECVVYGTCKIDVQSQVGVKLNKLGRISDIQKLVDLYSACDVFVTPSLADNYPNVIIEAMACGLPVVGFASGGIPEMIDNEKNGLLVSDFDAATLRLAIIKSLAIDYDVAEIRRTIVCRNSYKNHL
jgi:glycosyltransferase involved in cell wall biosynthesis